MQLLNSQKGVSHGELCIVSEEPTTAVVQCFSVLKPGGLFFFKDYGPSHGTTLTWHRRMKITLDIARGLEYLHERCNPPVIHVDLKSANIFLDSNFNAKISDFGLATTELLAKNKVKLSGTSAYVAPEYLSDGKLTDKSDGYAFGVLLLELLIGRRPVEKMSPSLFHSFVTWGVVAFWNRQSVRSFYIMHPHEVFKCAFKS